jgi:uncharacterized protein (TIGR02099 family)
VATAVVATVLILLALLVGVLRLLLPLAPEYQEDIRRFANQATGFDVRFDSLTASWPLAGPEVRFADVRIVEPGTGRLVLAAGDLRVGVSLLNLVRERRLGPGRIEVRRSTVTVVRTPEGRILVNDVPLEDLLKRPPAAELPRLDILVEGLQVRLQQPGRAVPETRFDITELAIELEPGGAGFSAGVVPRDGLARSVTVAGFLPRALLPGAPATAPPPGAWEVRLTARDLELARALTLALEQPGPVLAGRGGVEVRARVDGRSPVAVAVDLDIAGVTLAGGGGPLQSLALQADWAKTRSGWLAQLARLDVRRGDRAGRTSRGTVEYAAGRDGGGRYVFDVPRLVLADAYALVRAVAAPSLRDGFLPALVTGEVRDLSGAVSLGKGPLEYEARGELRGVGLAMPEPGFALRGVTGRVTADQGGGILDLAGKPLTLRLPTLFRKPLQLTRAAGRIAWRLPPAGPEVIAEGLELATADAEGRGRVQVSFPREGSPLVDVVARFRADSAPVALDYLPLLKFRPAAVDWLDRAIVAGSVPSAVLRWQGPLRGFPYGDGGGRFRAEFELADATLDYAPEWPRLESLAAKVVIDRTSLVSVQNQAALAGVPVQDAEVRVPDLVRDATVEVSSSDLVAVTGLLRFLRASPIARYVGPTLNDITGGGEVAAELDVRVPIARPDEFAVTGRFDARRASLGLRGVDFGLTDLAGTIRLQNTELRAAGVRGRFLDEPVTIDLRPAGPDEPGQSFVATVAGETPVPKLAAAFSLPFPEQLAGTMAWNATALIPSRDPGSTLQVRVASDLSGVSTSLPEPLAKAAADREPLDLRVEFPDRGTLLVDGGLARGLRWALRFTQREGGGFDLERGGMARGPAALPDRPGLVISGDYPQLRFEDWFAGLGAGGGGAVGTLRRIDLRTGRLSLFGQVFRDVAVDAERGADLWTVRLASERLAGTVAVPDRDDLPVRADLARLWLVEDDTGAGAGDGDADPRTLPPASVRVDDFILGDLRLGALDAQASQRGDGIVVDPVTTSAGDFRIAGNALWVVEGGDVARQRTELKLTLRSTNLRPTLEALGYDPVLEGGGGKVDAELVWPGGPRDDFLEVASGRVTVELDRGRFLAVEPGGGRMLGLLSVAALPRRLGLDFSDVTEKGLAFDAVKGEFSVDGGNAFTCNLGLTGPVADIGMVGRVGFRARDYEQLAVTRPHVSDVVAIGSAVVGGPVIGGAALLVAQIFRKPLSSLGESYYRVTGSWDAPVVAKVQRSEVDVTPFRDCERYLAEALSQLPPEVVP